MARELTGRQIRLPGELLGSAVHDPATTADVTLGSTHQNVGAQLQFSSDRTGTVLVSLLVYLDKTTSGEVATVEAQLHDGSSVVAGTTRTVRRLHSSDGAMLMTAAWVLSVSDGASYTLQAQLRRSAGSSSTIVARAGGSYPATVLLVAGLTG
jgi:hypothetical protein